MNSLKKRLGRILKVLKRKSIGDRRILRRSKGCFEKFEFLEGGIIKIIYKFISFIYLIII